MVGREGMGATGSLTGSHHRRAPRRSDHSKEAPLSDYDVRMVVLSTDDLDASIRFYTETLGMPLKFRDGSHFAAIDGGSITIGLATALADPADLICVTGSLFIVADARDHYGFAQERD